MQSFCRELPLGKAIGRVAADLNAFSRKPAGNLELWPVSD
ncbi:hypothetical protein EIO_2219 [Ketogulonicigenium vulgare Y25]|uniref:Uncharacterized protein n=1 Tax=Ketogulonicigenium vulgare (strain WSH-001) TaxID=759362 RepID=F9Y3I5_KETVW|nr:hypothetical protein EIO_2219 [Ketogulonicigenium vulgare Y25]AEM41605.1 hypothetical protein KVU_1766 [Ketogulonicigenium vulgare WSH-001]ALJ81720.1 hypothetical protein KVH_11440 [Ketogulonicigenium vulgare]AOZ55354.1 hypothetical protein KVC_2352 [Ketogulonicigenium vulgare]